MSLLRGPHEHQDKDYSNLQRVEGYTEIVLGLIIFLAAFVTIVRLAGQKNIKFLRLMLIIILLTSLIEIAVGCFVLKLVDVKDMLDS